LEHIGIKKGEKCHLLEFGNILNRVSMGLENVRSRQLTFIKAPNVVKGHIDIDTKRVSIGKTYQVV
jgi:hypothetical protein